MLIVLGFLMFVGLVLVHEYGHFFVARKTGVDVEEFGLGFPPKVYGKKLKSGLLLSINALPLGGFVRLKGEHDSAKSPGSFGATRLRNKVLIMVAGVVMNALTAVVLLTILAVIGMPKLIDNQFTIAGDTKVVRRDLIIGSLEKGSPADKSGLKERDILASIGDDKGQHTVKASQDLPALTSKYAGQMVTIEYRRGGDKLLRTNAQLRSSQEVNDSKKTDSPKGYLGVIPTEYVLQRSTWSAPIVAVGLVGQFTVQNVMGIARAVGNLFVGNTAAASSQVSGPIGVFRLIVDGSHLGIEALLLIMAVISITLALMNILPIPALDGGRLFVTLLFRFIKKPLSQKLEERIHGTGFLVLIGLVLLISIVDVKRFF